MAAVLIAFRLSPREQTGRVGVVVAAVAFAAATYVISFQGATLGGLTVIWSQLLFYLAGLALPASLAYAILRHRVLDLAFVLNRTLVYAITSGIVVVAFALLELLSERYLNELTRLEGIAIQLGIALAVGLGARAVHGRVDDLVDRVIFRERHEQERALLRFATTVQFYTQQDALIDAAVDAMIRYARVVGAAIYLLEGGALLSKSSRFCDATTLIDENDSAYADLRAHGQTIETREYLTTFPGERVYPMVLIGRVTGALALGERESGEAMPPDIDDAVKRVVAAVAIATESIQAARVRKELEALRASPFAARSAHS